MRFWPACLALLFAAACDFGDPTQQAEEVIARSLASSVQLSAKRPDGVNRSASGVVLSVDPDGAILILTAAHLLEPPVRQSLEVFEPRGRQRARARIVKVDKAADLAVVETSGLDVQPVTFQEAARLGDGVWVVSFPWGRQGTVVDGVVSQIVANELDGLPTKGPVALINAAVGYGTSGGGVFDGKSGALVGIVRGYRTAKLSIPGTSPQALEFPIAGETTVIPTPDILCLLQEAVLGERLQAAIPKTSTADEACPTA